MKTQCSASGNLFPDIAGRDAVVRFDAGDVSTDGGVLLLERTDRRVRLLSRFAAAFRDHRDASRVTHTVRELVTQRVFGLCLGYEDVSDHDTLGKDPLIAAACGRGDGPLAGKSTLSRLEMSRPGAAAASRYDKIELDQEKADQVLADVFMDAMGTADPGLIVLDVDASDIPLHGRQERRFFHGYYDGYCYLPLYIFAGEHLLVARLRSADQDAAAGIVGELKALVARLRRKWPKARVLIRGDSGFCREELMAWCEAAGHLYVLGLARDARLEKEIAGALKDVAAKHAKSKKAARLPRLRVGVRVTARKIWVSMSSSWPWQKSFEACAARLLAPQHVTKRGGPASRDERIEVNATPRAPVESRNGAETRYVRRVVREAG